MSENETRVERDSSTSESVDAVGDEQVTADQQYAAQWASNPNIPRLVDHLKRNEKYKEARKELFPLRGKMPADEWEQLARKVVGEG